MPASVVARTMASITLLASTGLVLELVFRVDAMAHRFAGQPGGALASLETHALALVLGVLVMLNIAWFGALLRRQTAEERLRAARVIRPSRNRKIRNRRPF